MKDSGLMNIRQKVMKSKGPLYFEIQDDGMLCYKDRKVIPADVEMKERILNEAHDTPYTVYPGSTKMY